jgi:hypothetical protein
MDILFHKTIEQCRQLGARGGRAHARNLRLRKFQPPVPLGAEIPGPPSETAHEASLRLDAQFPWLAAAFVRRVPTGGSRPSCESRLRPRALGCSAGTPPAWMRQFPGF